MKRIAYQGVKGSFSYMTALKQFGEKNTFIGMQTFKEVFEEVENGKADVAVLPIENSLIGSIYENFDLLNSYAMKIIGENYTKIEHCLLATKIPFETIEERLKVIKNVLSHPKALEQCSLFFQEHPWMKAVVYMDTAAAAAEVAVCKDPASAAIASESAAEIYGLEILRRGIEDDPRNYTRFATIAKEEISRDRADKCSLLMQLKHAPGALAEVLNLFANREINLTKIESRPLRGSPFKYLFYLDFEFSINTGRYIEDLLQVLSDHVLMLKILGFYKKGALWIS